MEMDTAGVANTDSVDLPFVQAVRGPYCVCTRGKIPEELATRIMQVVRSGPEAQPKGVLAGRGAVSACEIPPLGRVFVKRYAHGGLLRAVTGGRFLSIGPVRSKAELEMLEVVRGLGISAPQPFGYVTCGSMIYSTWLLMEEIQDVESLVELSKRDPDAVIEAMRQLSAQLSILLKHKILHVDLHPGNVLVNRQGTVFIVDFDKAHVFAGSLPRLKELYLRRWRRAVIKHGLSPLLTEVMSLTLRSHDE